MALHPDKQSKAQAELDAYLGPDRMPIIADRGKMPYVEACIKETLRWSPLVPLGNVSACGVISSVTNPDL